MTMTMDYHVHRSSELSSIWTWEHNSLKLYPEAFLHFSYKYRALASIYVL